jgi:hypothetical protein
VLGTWQRSDSHRPGRDIMCGGWCLRLWRNEVETRGCGVRKAGRQDYRDEIDAMQCNVMSCGAMRCDPMQSHAINARERDGLRNGMRQFVRFGSRTNRWVVGVCVTVCVWYKVRLRGSGSIIHVYRVPSLRSVASISALHLVRFPYICDLCNPKSLGIHVGRWFA